MEENKFGKLSRLQLRASLKDGRTILSDVAFTAPFKIMRPFYEKKDIMTVMLLTASAGIMAGDRQEFSFSVEEGAHMEFVSQAYEKIHKMTSGHAERNVSIAIAKNASMRYTPLPTIPFGQSDYRSRTEIYLEDASSQLVMTEILTAGRIAHGEAFAYRLFSNHIRVRQGEKLIYYDNTIYDPSRTEMTDYGMYEGFTHLGTMLLFNMPKSENWISQARQVIDDTADTEGGITRTADGHIVIRILGRSGDQLTRLFEALEKLPV